MPEIEQLSQTEKKVDVLKVKEVLNSSIEKIISLSKLLINDSKLQRHQVPQIKSQLSQEILEYEVLKRIYENIEAETKKDST